MAKFLIDTDWAIDYLNGISRAVKRIGELRKHGLALRVISVAELWEGVHYSKNRERSRLVLLEFLSGVSVLGVDERICERFGQLRGSLRQQGRLIGDFDLLIAASALVDDLTLLTNNRRHFAIIEGLHIESVPA